MQYFLSLFCFILLGVVNAQNTNHHVQSIIKANGQLFYKEFRVEENQQITAKNIDGIPYLDESFGMGEIYLNNKFQEKYLMRYNIYNEAFELMISPTEIRDLLRLKDMVINLNNKEYILLNYESRNRESKEGYFEILMDGSKAAFLLKNKKVLKEGRKARNSLEGDVPARFINATDYYIQLNNENPTYLKKLNLKELSKTLMIPEKKIKTIADANKLKLKKESDIIRLIDLINRS